MITEYVINGPDGITLSHRLFTTEGGLILTFYTRVRGVSAHAGPFTAEVKVEGLKFDTPSKHYRYVLIQGTNHGRKTYILYSVEYRIGCVLEDKTQDIPSATALVDEMITQKMRA